MEWMLKMRSTNSLFILFRYLFAWIFGRIGVQPSMVTKHLIWHKSNFWLYKDIYKLILLTNYPYCSWPNNWEKMIKELERCTQDIRVTEVKWQRHSNPILNLNKDGSALHNSGKIGGGILGDFNEDMIYAFTFHLALEPITKLKHRQQYMVCIGVSKMVTRRLF